MTKNADVLDIYVDAAARVAAAPFKVKRTSSSLPAASDYQSEARAGEMRPPSM